MATKVYANGNEISCKASKGKTSVAFPDPCWSPPPPPAGPIVLPYPNIAKPSSLKKGSKTVLIKGTMVALVDRSFFSKSNGNEPATPAFQKGFLTRKLTGKTYYKKWSQNVKFEGKGVCRHIDIMTHNHGSNPGNTAPFPFLSDQALANGTCKAEKEKIEENCQIPDDYEGDEKDWHWTKSHCKDLDEMISKAEEARAHILKTISQSESSYKSFLQGELDIINQMSTRTKTNRQEKKTATTKLSGEILAKAGADNKCAEARKCQLVPYTNKGKKRSDTSKKDDGGCCNGQTGHHLIPDAMVKNSGCPGYAKGSAPVICAEGSSHSIGSHGSLHTALDNELIRLQIKDVIKNDKLHVKQAINCATKSLQKTFPASGCSDACIKAQLRNYYDQCSGTQFDAVTKNGETPDTEGVSIDNVHGYM